MHASFLSAVAKYRFGASSTKKGKHGAQPAGKGTFTNSTIHKQKMASRASHLQSVELASFISAH
jgi:hypothetical protein